MKSYSEKLRAFSAAHPCGRVTAAGASFRYVLCGVGERTLVLLNGGMNTLEMWMDYVDDLARDSRVLLFDYPRELKTNQAQAAGMLALFETLGIQKPIFVGASDGGMVAQIYVQKYPGETGGLVLISTGGMDERTLRSLKKKYRLAPHAVVYEALQLRKAQAPAHPGQPEPSPEREPGGDRLCPGYVRDHLPGLSPGKGRAHLLPPGRSHEPEAGDGGGFFCAGGEDPPDPPGPGFFSGEMQQDLIGLMHQPKIVCVSGGHLGTVLKAEDDLRAIRAFLQEAEL